MALDNNTKIAHPKIIAFEGVDGTGKSTAIKLISKLLTKEGILHLVTQELSGGKMQLEFRKMLMECKSPMDELLVISLARRWHYENILLPAIEEKKIILIDRFIASTYAYQGQYLDPSLIEFFEKKVWQVPSPFLTVCFIGNCLRKEARDRFEQKGEDFFDKVRQIYKTKASIAPKEMEATELLDGESSDASLYDRNNEDPSKTKNLVDKKVSIPPGSWIFAKAGQEELVYRAVVLATKKN